MSWIVGTDRDQAKVERASEFSNFLESRAVWEVVLLVVVELGLWKLRHSTITSVTEAALVSPTRVELGKRNSHPPK